MIGSRNYSKSSLNVVDRFLETAALSETVYSEPVLPQANGY